jgi:hypothetical protein
LLEHRGRRADLDDDAVAHKRDPVGDLLGESDLVRDDDHCHALAGELLDDGEHLADKLGVERRGDLVEKHHRGAHRQRAGDRDTLTLAAREVLRIGAGLVGETDFGEQLTALGLGGAAWHAFNDRRAGRDVGECRHVREQVEC